MASDSFVLLPDQMYGAAVEDTDGGGCSDNGDFDTVMNTQNSESLLVGH